MIKFTIPFIPPSMNKYKGRENAHEYRSDKKEWERIVWVCCRPAPEKPVPKCILTITHFFPNRHRHDPNNYDGQFITDGLVKAKIIADDSFDCIELVLKGRYDKEKPRVEIEITEVHNAPL
jgi:Holliday junction resolvase RusA-like endonuclease